MNLRFLFRLSQSPHVERFVLKGALMLRTHAIEQPRLTRDIDLLGYGPSRIEHLEQIVRDCLRLDVPDDGLSFDPESVEGSRISQEAEYQGVRIRFTGHLGNARTVMQPGTPVALTPAFADDPANQRPWEAFLYEAIKNGESITLPGFGGFYVRPGRSSWTFKFNPAQRLRALFGWSSTYKGPL